MKDPKAAAKTLSALVALALIAASCNGGTKKVPSGRGLVGLFRLTAGACEDAGVTKGTYFRMVQPRGSVSSGPFVTNTDSPCGDQTFSPMKPGSDGGLITGEDQPHPQSPFDASGNGSASRITTPTKWFGVAYSLTTNAKDPQTGLEVEVPRITVTNGKISGDLRAFAAAWNGQHFNQGSPKPDATKPGSTSGPSGTYDDSTRSFTIVWTSQIVGGPFNNFIGTWHLEGTFEPKAS